MTNEELAERIQSGDQSASTILWDQIRNFVAWSAKRVIVPLEEIGAAHGLEIDDFINTGYLVMLEALEDYDSTKGLFITWYSQKLRPAFNKLTGYSYRSVKVWDPEKLETVTRYRPIYTEPAMAAQSLNEPAYKDTDGESIDLQSTIEDPAAVEAFEEVENSEYQRELQIAVQAALDSLPENMRHVLYRRFWDGATLREIGAELNRNHASVQAMQRDAFNKIRKSSVGVRLRSFIDFDYYKGTGYAAFVRNRTSVQERYVMKREEAENKARRIRRRAERHIKDNGSEKMQAQYVQEVK